MQHHRSLFLFVTGSFFLSVVGCAGDAMKSSSEPPSTTQTAQAQEGKEQPPSGEVQERAVPLPRPGPSGPPPFAPPPLYVGPTQNITKVANALQVKARSLTIQVTAAPGLALTQPVTISIAFSGQGANRLTQPYAASTGNKFLYNDPEGNGQPRPAHVDITFTEPKPGGGLYSYTVPGNLTLYPLYDVKIDPLLFQLLKDCECPLSQHTDNYFYWLTPEMKGNFSVETGEKMLHFYLGGLSKMTNTIFEFAWARSEVSPNENLHLPVFFWDVPECLPELPLPRFMPTALSSDGAPIMPLFPARTQTYSGGLTSTGPGTQSCNASYQYTITYTLRSYLAL